MKRKLPLALAAVLSLSVILSGCSSNTSARSSNSGDSTDKNQSSTAEKTINKGDYFITVATGPTSGLYYPIGGASSIIFQNNIRYDSSAHATGASADNINVL